MTNAHQFFTFNKLIDRVNRSTMQEAERKCHQAHRTPGILHCLILLVCLAGPSFYAHSHGGRHPERTDQRDAGWLSRAEPASAVVWASPKLLKSGEVELSILHVFKGDLLPSSLIVTPVSVSRAKAQGSDPQLVFLTRHDESEQSNGWHWSIGRHDTETKAPSLEAAAGYFNLIELQEMERCTPELATLLAGITFQTPRWLSKLALLDSFGLCKSQVPRLTKNTRAYLRQAQQDHQSGGKKASPSAD